MDEEAERLSGGKAEEKIGGGGMEKGGGIWALMLGLCSMSPSYWVLVIMDGNQI